MSDLQDVKNAVKICEQNKNLNIVIMQCGSDYPLKHRDTNLKTLTTFKSNFKYRLGFSDHTTSEIAGITSVGLGATVFEKHVTLNKNLLVQIIFLLWSQMNLRIIFIKLKKLINVLGQAKKIY